MRVCDSCYSESGTSDKKGKAHTETENTPSVTVRYIGENITSAMGWVGGALRYPSKLVTDVTRPTYWTPDHLITNCYVCQMEFGEKFQKHHCRSCGQGVCDECSMERRPLLGKGWDYPVRVCDECLKKL